MKMKSVSYGGYEGKSTALDAQPMRFSMQVQFADDAKQHLTGNDDKR